MPEPWIASRRDIWRGEVRSRLSGLRLSPTRENEIVDELSQHLEDRWRELMAGGASADEATRLALAEFRTGNFLAQHMAPLPQAQVRAPITPGAPAGRIPRDAGPQLRDATALAAAHPAAAVVALAGRDHRDLQRRLLGADQAAAVSERGRARADQASRRQR